MKTTKASCLPSEIIGIDDEWAAYQFDTAVITVGTAIENASQEMDKRGDDENPHWEPRYTMKQLLSPEFRLPAEVADDDFEELQGAHGFHFDEVS